MSLLSISNKPTDETNRYFNIRKDNFFLDEENQEHFLKNGWCVVKNVVRPEEIGSFMGTFNEISKIEGFALDNHFMNSGCLHNPEVRKKTQDVINMNTRSVLPRMFNMDKVNPHTGGSYQIKPASPVSELEVHQDSAVVDEEKDYCLFLWIPFCDVTEINGPIWVLPGSHLWGNTQRSLTVPWNFCEHTNTLREYMFPVTVNLGDAQIFDPALVHGSTANLSENTRHSITITVLRQNYQLIYYFKDDNMAANTIEKYEVDENFYKDYDFHSKPDATKWKKSVVAYKPYIFDKEELVQLIEKHLPQ